jgi:hypothetical protein
MPEDKQNQWEERQQEMEDWDEDLITDPAAAAHSFARGYAPYASLLAELSGEVLDVGGGIGIVRDYLSDSIEYTVIDPSLS